MQIEEPNWVGQRARCEKCDIRITLEAGDKDKVEYLGYRWQRGHVPPGLTNMRLFRLYCPKCNALVLFDMPILEDA